MPVTSPDNIYYLDNDSPAGLIPYSTTLATSIQEALDERSESQQLRTYRWADESEQAAQSGMQRGDMGYREDLDNTYRWNGVAWDAVIEFRQEVLTLTQGTTNPSNLPPTVVRQGKMVTIFGRVQNGNGLTLGSAYQPICNTVPEWARPSLNLHAGASATSTSSTATVTVTPEGDLSVASSGTVASFSFSYPAAM